MFTGEAASVAKWQRKKSRELRTTIDFSVVVQVYLKLKTKIHKSIYRKINSGVLGLSENLCNKNNREKNLIRI